MRKDKTLPPQTQKVLDVLRVKSSLTAAEALRIGKVASLSSRISELRKAGHVILKEYCRDPFDGQRYVRYYLADNEDLQNVA